MLFIIGSSDYPPVRRTVQANKQQGKAKGGVLRPEKTLIHILLRLLVRVLGRGVRATWHHVVAAGMVSPSSMPRGRVPLEGTQAWQSART